MPRSKVIILTDPLSDLSVNRIGVSMYPIQGEYSREKLMLQRIRSYIVREICNSNCEDETFLILPAFSNSGIFFLTCMLISNYYRLLKPIENSNLRCEV